MINPYFIIIGDNNINKNNINNLETGAGIPAKNQLND